MVGRARAACFGCRACSSAAPSGAQGVVATVVRCGRRGVAAAVAGEGVAAALEREGVSLVPGNAARALARCVLILGLW